MVHSYACESESLKLWVVVSGAEQDKYIIELPGCAPHLQRAALEPR